MTPFVMPSLSSPSGSNCTLFGSSPFILNTTFSSVWISSQRRIVMLLVFSYSFVVASLLVLLILCFYLFFVLFATSVVPMEDILTLQNFFLS